MMETAVENAVCEGCGVEIRDKSLFCYNCGGAVPGAVDESLPETVVTDDAGRDGDVRVDGDAVPAASGTPEMPLRGPGKPERLRTAASMRKRKKAYNRRPVEMVWKEPEGVPRLFIIASIVLTVFVAILLYLAFSLR